MNIIQRHPTSANKGIPPKYTNVQCTMFVYGNGNIYTAAIALRYEISCPSVRNTSEFRDDTPDETTDDTPDKTTDRSLLVASKAMKADLPKKGVPETAADGS